ncbi:hemin uptake protein HemP [Corticibacterium sp. UT-5YL-CI-8]|nr:hemin uptake protein HemP [Tianweitania sp. UT-5YL-CI-8]
MNQHNPDQFRAGGFRRPEADAGRVANGPLAVRTLTSESLFDGAYEIGINHGGSLYRLKITRQGKLILNK